ncbi:invasion associated locus B family protein [Alphaproteobacteria bacterium GH1-50]|uniref:Invasion associated locus B family protein n=1 Tax=Kangsaoukella pontilimi TaxID=2691042 RepID=A0A7C9MVM1_9RHOB|nr:invasion associated locus B family protein [Kangsaoukella pontilimi]MXQ06934.1 invasion associated locus B family protein [Kangsaoukella pontilimi]
MGKTLYTLLLCLALAPATALAQDSGQTGTDATEGVVGDSTTPDDGGLSLGTPESDGPQVGDTYVAGEFTDWQLRCVRAEDGNDPCQLYQLLADDQGNAVAEINIFALPAGQEAAAGATVITPLETLLTAQLRLAIDGGEARRYPFAFCTQIGCYARLGFRAEEIEQLKRGASGTVTLVSAALPTEPVALKVSLSGFTAGWNALSGAQ